MGKKNKDIEANKQDLKASVLKSTVGIVPFAGPFLSEVVGAVIPNQRIDRIGKFVKELDERLSRFEQSYLNELIKDEECVDLIEECFISASRGISQDRRKYIATLLENGLSEERIEFLETKYLLKLLNELNDMEVLWLRYFYDTTRGGDSEFREKHADVFKIVVVSIGSDEETRRKGALQESYKDHLKRLRLIDEKIKFDRKLGMPEYDQVTGKPKSYYNNVSVLGNNLLRYIGMIQ
ncbi:hypothetical protein PQO03_17715 [Lentisphaera profundi]|uniref:Uncharacterized protein n=1 Tax=Lentisphaera profundi TaxID=1658616 RepID=A0ABY7VU18_9BACT|nr:hypothetical protein [Lentisphaera profundi]WDE97665.1 hypothetical protein PQO03_17715 [Lentisphaera profundi]